MPRGDKQAQNHPRAGYAIEIDPITDICAIEKIKRRLWQENKRDFCLFTLGINTPLRGCALLSLTIGEVEHLRLGNVLRPSSTGIHQAAIINGVSIDAIQAWLDCHPSTDRPRTPLFLSQRADRAVGLAALNRLVTTWCEDDGLKGNYGGASLRKTWGYHQYVRKGTPIQFLMGVYGHQSSEQTLDFLRIPKRGRRDASLTMNPGLSDLYLNMEI